MVCVVRITLYTVLLCLSPPLPSPPLPPTHSYYLQLETFLMMYRTHCQRIVDTVVRTNFDDVRVTKQCVCVFVSIHAYPVLP